MPSATATVWTPDLIDALTRHWGEKVLSARQIASVMGLPSKHSVIGKVHRLGLSRRPPVNPPKPPRKVSAEKVVAERRRQLRVRDARRKSIAPYIILNNLAARSRDRKLPELSASKTIGIPFMEIGPRQCHYVLGEPVANALMCGAPTDGRRYCAHHHDRCHIPAPRKVERA